MNKTIEIPTGENITKSLTRAKKLALKTYDTYEFVFNGYKFSINRDSNLQEEYEKYSKEKIDV